jgi:hypothetical protein
MGISLGKKKVSIKNVVVWNVCMYMCVRIMVFLRLVLWWAMYNLLGIESLTFILTHIV